MFYILDLYVQLFESFYYVLVLFFCSWIIEQYTVNVPLFSYGCSASLCNLVATSHCPQESKIVELWSGSR